MARRCDKIRLAASTSFTPEEIWLLNTILSRVEASNNSKRLVNTVEFRSVTRKVLAMKKRIDTIRALRAALAAEMGEYDPNRDHERENG